MILLVTLFLLPNLTQAFFGLGGGGGCGCPQPACPPPPPAPVCPPPQPCSPCGAAVARGAKIQQPQAPIGLPDELELRAAAFGVPVHHQPQQAPSNIEQLEKLVERYEPIENNRGEIPTLAEPESPHEADADLMKAGLKGGADIRRAPTVIISHQEDPEPSTTIAASTEAPESTKVKGDEETDQSKCNSQVLHKLMLDNMSDNSSESKRKINTAAEEKFGGNVDVVCSRGHFSYVFSSNLYCEATKGLTTCIAFRQVA